MKQFFNEKEVTSTLVMDALYSGCKQIDQDSCKYLKVRCRAHTAAEPIQQQGPYSSSQQAWPLVPAQTHGVRRWEICSKVFLFNKAACYHWLCCCSLNACKQL